ncbi:MAG: fibrobacter succinogenes major paralogous domain-containing protein [Bacteroidales bacterium]|nr:fibrobacter succinogenes major paralogous domain-containing protein [Bacteroidales bacterium]
MRKALLIMAAALMTMTQCRKQETMPVTPSANTIKMTVTAGSGAKTDINTETGAITWSAGDKLYVSDGTNWLGSLTLVGNGGSSQGTFTGNIAGIDETETTCHFFYLGHDNGMEEPTGTAAANISLASQDGTLAGAMKYHAGYGTTDVTVESGEYHGYVVMNTKIAIAHLNFTTDGTTAYKGSVTMGGTGISNTLTVSPGGIFSGGGEGGIAIDKGYGTTGERYVTLIPTGETSIFVAFTGDATGGMTFANGIQANKFYGMKDAVKVTLEAAAPAGRFTVGMDGETPRKVEFAPGNLWYGKAENEETAAFKFEANQWSFADTWNANHVSHFYWSKTASVAYAGSYSESGTTTSDEFFTNSSSFQVAGETAGTWRTLSKAEWNYLLNSRTNASSLRAWKDLGNNVKGLVILPDGDASVMSGITSTSHLETYGAVFLPASGYRDGTDVHDVGSYGYYWSGTPYEVDEDCAYLMTFFSGVARTYYGLRNYGRAVRLVR